MGYFQEKDEKQSIQQSRQAKGSIVPHQSHRLIASMPHLTDAGACAKGASASIKCRNEHTFVILRFDGLWKVRAYRVLSAGSWLFPVSVTATG